MDGFRKFGFHRFQSAEFGIFNGSERFERLLTAHPF